MDVRMTAVLAAAFAAWAAAVPAWAAQGEHALNARQRAIIPIAAFTASGDMDRLAPALHEGLDAGLTVNEVKEILVQMYAYAGFPRSLNGIHAFMAVLDERKGKGIRDEEGAQASPLSTGTDRGAYGARVRAMLAGQDVISPPQGYQLFAPVIDTFLKEHLFADIFSRDNLDHQSRELATVAALAAMSGTEGQLLFHLGAALNTGLDDGQLQDFVRVLGDKVGETEAGNAGTVLAVVLAQRK